MDEIKALEALLKSLKTLSENSDIPVVVLVDWLFPESQAGAAKDIKKKILNLRISQSVN